MLDKYFDQEAAGVLSYLARYCLFYCMIFIVGAWLLEHRKRPTSERVHVQRKRKGVPHFEDVA